jgi:hypothetical protein
MEELFINGRILGRFARKLIFTIIAVASQSGAYCGDLSHSPANLILYTIKDWISSCDAASPECEHEMDGAISAIVSLDLYIKVYDSHLKPNICLPDGSINVVSKSVIAYLRNNKENINENFGRGVRRALVDLYGCSRDVYK